MNLSKRLKLYAIIIISFVVMVIAVAMVFRGQPRGLVITSSIGPAAGVFMLSNSADRAISGCYKAPEIQSNGLWRRWNGSSYEQENFYLAPGSVINRIVPLPWAGLDVRIPFDWGYDKHSVFQKVAPRLHTRLSNLINTVRNSGNVYGWSDPYGYLPDETMFYYITNVQPDNAANRSQPVSSESNQASIAVER